MKSSRILPVLVIVPGVVLLTLFPYDLKVQIERDKGQHSDEEQGGGAEQDFGQVQEKGPVGESHRFDCDSEEPKEW